MSSHCSIMSHREQFVLISFVEDNRHGKSYIPGQICFSLRWLFLDALGFNMYTLVFEHDVVRFCLLFDMSFMYRGGHTGGHTPNVA